MNDIERIQNNPGLQMELSKLLLAKIEPEICWHNALYINKYEGVDEEPYYILECGHCKTRENQAQNPNLFASGEKGWIGFGRVWEAMKKRGDFKNRFCYEYGYFYETVIATPYFQLEVLRWLDPEGLEEKLDHIQEETT